MSEYEHSIVVEAAPEAVFDFVSDIQNSPVSIPAALPSNTQSLAEARATDGWVRIYAGEYLLEWGSDGDQSYSGWLQIEEMDDDISEITMHLSYPSRLDFSEAAVRQELLSAMQRIKERVERRPQSLDTLSL
ncbi:hypothetical protein CCAX7_009550 [Capsulimonas corticalis]|uniref:Uncharacterized protein n=1 Tax=Capsulimonas corticalis TaxID=2219043 RepID=A0A402CUB3_9BACT|nr:SRPBCC family protein [Capsulimonas corticalis]BDI28904.1 hypothetical protein CCAX7_009550 [Capsulimonas corticalis]